MVLASGSVNATTFDWRPMPGVADFQARYEQWKKNDLRLRSKATGGTGAAIGLAVGSGIASGLMWGAAVAKGKQIDEAITAADGATGDDFDHWSDVYKSAQRDERGFVVGGSAAGVVAAVGVGLTFVLAARGKRALATLGEWDGE